MQENEVMLPTLKPFCVSTEELTNNEGQTIFNLAVKAGANSWEYVYDATNISEQEEQEYVSGDHLEDYDYIGVDYENDTLICDSLDDFHDNLLAYSEALDYLNNLLEQQGNLPEETSSNPSVEALSQELSESEGDCMEGYNSTQKHHSTDDLDTIVPIETLTLPEMLSSVTPENKHEELLEQETILSPKALALLKSQSLIMQINCVPDEEVAYTVMDEEGYQWDVDNIDEMEKVVNAIRVLEEFAS